VHWLVGIQKISFKPKAQGVNSNKKKVGKFFFWKKMLEEEKKFIFVQQGWNKTQ
jgi:hypothetical protein